MADLQFSEPESNVQRCHGGRWLAGPFAPSRMSDPWPHDTPVLSNSHQLPLPAILTFLLLQACPSVISVHSHLNKPPSLGGRSHGKSVRACVYTEVAELWLPLSFCFSLSFFSLLALECLALVPFSIFNIQNPGWAAAESQACRFTGCPNVFWFISAYENFFFLALPREQRSQTP